MSISEIANSIFDGIHGAYTRKCYDEVLGMIQRFETEEVIEKWIKRFRETIVKFSEMPLLRHDETGELWENFSDEVELLLRRCQRRGTFDLSILFQLSAGIKGLKYLKLSGVPLDDSILTNFLARERSLWVCQMMRR